MVQVIYSFKNSQCPEGRYPFGRIKQSNHTYMQYLLQCKNQQQVQHYRLFNSLYKKLTCPHLMKLFKFLKQDNKFHMLYEYYPKSLENRLTSINNQEQLTNIFIELETVFEELINQKIKAMICIQYIGVDQANKLKVWIRPEDVDKFYIVDRDLQLGQNQMKKCLHQFYETQRMRLHLEIEEIIQTNNQLIKVNNKTNEQNNILSKKSNLEKQHYQNNNKSPNFVIEGNTLVFVNKVKTDQQNKKQQNNQHNQHNQHSNINDQHSKNNQHSHSKQENIQNEIQTIDLNKMTIAQKVLYYKKQQSINHNQTDNSNKIIIKDTSTSNASQNDISKSSDNDSTLKNKSENDSSFKIKTQIINKNKMKIITQQEIQVEGNSDEDVQKLAKQKILEIRKKNKLQTIHNEDEKCIKSLELENNYKNKQMQKKNDKIHHNKIMQAKLKAKTILDKYSQKSKK